MAAKVVITDYVWESLDVERNTLAGLADIVPMKTKKPEEFLAEAADCDALLNTYAGPITAEAMAKMPRCRIIARYGIGVDTIDLEAATQRRHHRHQQPDLLHRGGGRAHHGPPPRLRAQGRRVRPAGARRALGSAARQAHVPARRAHAGARRLRPHRARGGAPCRRLRHDGALRRSVREGRRRSRHEGGARRPPAQGRLRLRASPAHAADARHDRRRGVREDEAHGVPGELRPRPDRGHGGAGARARRRENRRLRARHRRSGAAAGGTCAARPRQRDHDAARRVVQRAGVGRPAGGRARAR